MARILLADDNADGVTGAEGPGMSVELGWSKNPTAPFS